MEKLIVVVLVILLIPLIIFINTWLIMLVLGGIASVIEKPAFALSFWQTLPFSILLGIIGNALRQK